MFIETPENTYFDGDTGATYQVQTHDANNPLAVSWVEVYNPNWGGTARKLSPNYPTKEEALAALDEFMSAHEPVQFAPVTTEEEKGTN